MDSTYVLASIKTFNVLSLIIRFAENMIMIKWSKIDNTDIVVLNTSQNIY